MPNIWCAISAHGLGHAAQIIPVLNALGAVVDDVHVILRTTVPASIFKENLNVSWDLQVVPQDIGCVQRGPLEIDINETWAVYQAFHENLNEKVSQEAQAMHHAKVDLVISNISYLAIASAFHAKCPAVAIASLSWDQVLQPYIEPSTSKQQDIYEHIREEYAKANCLIRLHPGIDMPAFSSIIETGPSFPHAEGTTQDVRKVLGIGSGEKLVLIAFGGIPLTALPLEQLDAYKGYHFLVGGIPLKSSSKRIHSIDGLTLPFREIMKQADVVMTKPGYATITSAVHYGVPVVYVRRYNFADEQSLVDYVGQYGRAVELTREDFESGTWEKALHEVLTLPHPLRLPPRPELEAVAKMLKDYL